MTDPSPRLAEIDDTPVVDESIPHFVVTAEGDLLGVDSPENIALARRIRACVNACEGISTEELEAGIVGDMWQVIADVVPVLQRQVRDKVG